MFYFMSTDGSATESGGGGGFTCLTNYKHIVSGHTHIKSSNPLDVELGAIVAGIDKLLATHPGLRETDTVKIMSDRKVAVDNLNEILSGNRSIKYYPSYLEAYYAILRLKEVCHVQLRFTQGHPKEYNANTVADKLAKLGRVLGSGVK